MKKMNDNKNIVFQQMKLDELEKNRGYATTIKTAWSAFFNNFKTIFKHVWPYSIVFSLAAAFYVMQTLKLAATELATSDIVIIAASYILLLLVTFIFTGRVYMLVNDKPLGWNVFRAFKLFLAELVVVLVLSVIVAGIALIASPSAESLSEVPQNAMQIEQTRMAFVKTFSIVMVLSLFLLLLLLPYVYAASKYMIDTKSKLVSLIWKGYKTGLRHWGYIFLTLLLTTICLFFVMLILGLPLGVLNTAVRVDELGVASGDPSGMPCSIGTLTFFTAAITFFCYSFITVFSVFVAYYLYGSIERRVKERKQAKMQISVES
ncbi:MAG: hypothetical protein K5893_05210 [Prevotella sp.]|nr:hypothetical protein [Prevotella sp.]